MCMVQVDKMLPADELIINLKLTLKLLHFTKLLHACMHTISFEITAHALQYNKTTTLNKTTLGTKICGLIRNRECL